MASDNQLKPKYLRKWMMLVLVIAIVAVLIVAVILVFYLPTLKDRSLTITSTSASLEGIEVFKPSDKVANPEAGDPSYVFLMIDEEAVELSGPDIQSSDSFYLEGESIIETEEDSEHFLEDGYEVRVNAHLMYVVEIEDFEGEVDLAAVELRERNEMINSRFIFVATGSGVAHDVTIVAERDGARVGNSTPVSIECNKRWVPVQAEMRTETIAGGFKGVFESVNPSPSWSQVVVTLVEWRDLNSSQVSWTPNQADLGGGSSITYPYPSSQLGSLTVVMAVTDVSGDGYMSMGDSIAMTTEGQSFDPDCRYVLWLIDYNGTTIVEVEF